MKKKEKKKSNKQRLKERLNSLIAIVVLFVVGLWCIDIGASAMVLESSGVEVFVQTLFLVRTAQSQYHIGLILSLACFVILACLYISEILKDN